jgi:uncharacterized RDD family membrane protein YckC
LIFYKSKKKKKIQALNMGPDEKNVETYAGFVPRFLAFIFDSIIISAIVLAFFVFVVPFLYHPFPMVNSILSGPLVSDNSISFIFNMLFVWMEFFLIVQCFYVTFLESSSYQGTFGKMIFGLSVTDIAGSRISVIRAFVRGLGLIISFLLFCSGYILILFTKNKQGLHDIIAATYVIHRPENSGHPHAKTMAAIAVLAGLAFMVLWPSILSAVLPDFLEMTNPGWNKVTIKGVVNVSVNKTDENHINITYLGGPDAQAFTNLQVYATDDNQSELMFWLKPQSNYRQVPAGTSMIINGSFKAPNRVRVYGNFYENASYLSHLLFDRQL